MSCWRGKEGSAAAHGRTGTVRGGRKKKRKKKEKNGSCPRKTRKGARVRADELSEPLTDQLTRSS